MYLNTSAVPDALLPWQPNSPTSIKCPRPGAELVQYCSTSSSFFFVCFFFFFHLVILFAAPIRQTTQLSFISLISHTVFKQSLLERQNVTGPRQYLGPFIYLFFCNTHTHLQSHVKVTGGFSRKVTGESFAAALETWR